MPLPELPFCSSCSVPERITTAPEIIRTEAVQQVAGYVDDFKSWVDGYVAEASQTQEELESEIAKGEEVYDPDEDFMIANDTFYGEAQETKRQILDYIDLLPAGVSAESLIALNGCAHRIGNGQCAYTNILPGFGEQT